MSKVSGTTKLQVNVMMNNEKTKVLFAEANNDFIDVLLSFLTLPLGKVASILRKHNGEEKIGSSSCLNTLYTGLLNLDGAYFSVAGAKQMLLNPPSSSGAECRKLKLDITDSSPCRFFICQDQNCTKNNYCNDNKSLYSDIATCECGKSLNREVSAGEVVEPVGAFTSSNNPSSFIITDDLFVAPMTGIIQTLNTLANTDDGQVAEMMSFSFGIDEIMDLLMFSLSPSSTPLTDTIVKKTQTSSIACAVKPEPLHHVHQEDGSSRKMVLKVCLQKSTNMFLFAVGTDEFVELLFSFLTIPLGGVEFLLGGKIGLQNIDNLYRSVSNDRIDLEYFATPETKDKLINPKLPYGCGSKNQFLPLREDSPPKLRCRVKWTEKRFKVISFHEKEGESVTVSDFKSSKENYVKKQTMCFVGDDLTVGPCLATGISILKDLGVPFSDVKEMELQIGVEEALRVLKASLTSRTAITDVLIKPMLKLERQPKQEPS